MGWLAGFVELVWAMLVEMWPTVIIEANNVGIRFTLGYSPKVLAPGVRRSLPIIENVEVFNALPQWVDLPEQVVTTADDESLIISGAIYYEITDPYLFYMKVQDPDDSLIALAQIKIARCIAKSQYEDCKIEDIISSVRKPLRGAAAKWGVKILDVSVNQLAHTKVYWIGGGSPTMSIFE